MEYVYPVITGLLGLVIGVVVAGIKKKSPFANKQQEELGLKVATKASSDLEFARRLDALFLPPPPPKPSGEPVRLLGLLQREARLIDFLMEPIGAYTDDQIGASVRDIHAKAGAVIRKHLTLDPVLPQTEGDKVTVPSGFDPSAIRLVGNVGGKPPFTGTLQHAGWKVKKIDLPKPADGVDEFVLMPAEVEM
ncbi:DUF2760 domain-containing protein [Telmatocola sphagniphila]|jgi:hypothetical protein|uniref:DUF2760 domain-containing protein n=1 Tax=Telmatocola sphagniphila TaxID=1123043 RepID=A0A8E6EU83_9BACT|nr:DUF2760 domain-containing protein [Telmatocola sphagniphila]QVL31060.1 DUF2760 domain-containing protein [Telmatocola sphagniphila]